MKKMMKEEESVMKVSMKKEESNNQYNGNINVKEEEMIMA